MALAKEALAGEEALALALADEALASELTGLRLRSLLPVSRSKTASEAIKTYVEPWKHSMTVYPVLEANIS